MRNAPTELPAGNPSEETPAPAKLPADCAADERRTAIENERREIIGKFFLMHFCGAAIIRKSWRATYESDIAT